MGPICIAPELKRKGYGKISLIILWKKQKSLMRSSMLLKEILILRKSGFRQASEFGIRYHGLPEGEDASFLSVRRTDAGIS